MKTAFREFFDSDLSALNEAARTFQQIPNLKRLESSGKYYRIRPGEYRLGFAFENGAVTFIRCLQRKEIYRYFP